MRLPTRIAILFALMVGAAIGGSFYVFRTTVGLSYRKSFIKPLHSANALAFGVELERRAAGRSLSAPKVLDWLRSAARQRGVEVALLDEMNRPVFSTSTRSRIWILNEALTIACGDRRCEVTNDPPHPTTVELRHSGGRVAKLAMTQRTPAKVGQRVFITGMLLISFFALLGVVAFSIYLTRPLQRMSRSMGLIAGGELEHRVVVTGRDEVALMGRAFNAMADRVEWMVRSQMELMAGISHELRAPLSRMKLSLEMLREAGGSTQRVDALDREVDGLERLVDELLLLSRIDLAATSLTPEQISVRDLVEVGWQRISAEVGAPHPLDQDPASSTAISGLRPVIDTELDIQIHPDAAVVRVDRALGIRVLGNLLENAHRYAGTPITVETRRADERVLITVSDQGPGVPPEALPRLFEPFYQVDKAMSRSSGGTGVGLMIVRRAVEAHGGKVSAALLPEGGLAVTFDLSAG